MKRAFAVVIDLACVLVAVGGCTQKEQPAAKAEQTDEAKPDDAKPDDAKSDDAKSDDDTRPDDTRPDDTKSDDTKPDDPKPTGVPHATTAWVELPDMGKVEAFHPLVLGVLASCDPAGEHWCEIDGADKLVPSKIEDPDDEDILGVWPSDAWRVEIEEEESDGDEDGYERWDGVRLSRWSGSAFEEQRKLRVDVDPLSEMAGLHDYWVRKSWAGGVLLGLSNGDIERVPKHGAKLRLPGTISTTFEAETGGLFWVTDEGTSYRRYIVHAPCPQRACDDRSFELPTPGTEHGAKNWDFLIDVPRGGGSLTIAVESDEGDTFLLHWDPTAEAGGAGRWTFESAEELNLDALWPDANGGLWADAVDDLRYRDASGRWFVVETPAEHMSVAMRMQPRELVMLTFDDAKASHVYAARGPVTPRGE